MLFCSQRVHLKKSERVFIIMLWYNLQVISQLLLDSLLYFTTRSYQTSLTLNRKLRIIHICPLINYYYYSLHGKLGLFVFVYLFIQLLFGITIALTPTLYGSIDKAKSLWKYHRILGYVLLLLVWFTSQLGVRADYMYNNLYDTKLIYLHWLSLIFVVTGLVYRTRTRKWGVRFSQ